MFKRAEGGTVEVKQFGYGPLNGPFNWASLEIENEACKGGANQSPINIGKSPTVLSLHRSISDTIPDAGVTVAPEKPIMNIPEVDEVEFENLGTTIEVLANGTTSFAGSDFRLVQFHMHTPSEHHLNGEYHPLEIHMVHQGVGTSPHLSSLHSNSILKPSAILPLLTPSS